MVLAAAACFRDERVWIRRLGVWLVLATIGMTVWFLTDRWYLVLMALTAWFVIPVSQAALMSRRLQFSLKRTLMPGPLDAEEFPEIHPISNELRELGFVRESDEWLRPSPLDQGFRIFHHSEQPHAAALAVVKQGAISLSYLIYATTDCRGQVWITWDYPLAYGLKIPPHFQVYRCLEAEDVAGLFEQHRNFIEINEVEVLSEPGDAKAVFEQLFKETMLYNLDQGLLHPMKESEEQIGYSWRGTLYISWQVFIELVTG